MPAADLCIPCVEGSLDGDDELRNDRQDFAPPSLQHVLHPLHCQELVGLLCLPDAVKEDWQVVVVVQLAHVHLQAQQLVSHASCHHTYKFNS